MTAKQYEFRSNGGFKFYDQKPINKYKLKV